VADAGELLGIFFDDEAEAEGAVRRFDPIFHSNNRFGFASAH
jgi:hypothetical protein